MENYYAACYWRDRKEDADACTSRVVSCLRGLARCDRVFEDVHAVPRQYKLPYRIAVDTETIKALVEAGRNREDIRPYKVIEKLGFSRAFVSDFRKPEEKWVLSFMGGAYPNTPGLLNNCVLTFPKAGEARERLLTLPTTSCILTELIDVWDPDWALVQSPEFLHIVGDKGGIPGKALAGWMVYFASHLGKVPDDLPVHSRIELRDKGTVLILSPEPISSGRSDHIEAAKKLVTALQSAGLIPI